MPTSTSLPDLIALLRQGTDRGSLAWTETVEQNRFRCSFGKGTVELIFQTTPPIPDRYGIALFDAKNTLLEELWARSEGDAQAMGDLYDKVRRSVLRIDQAIQDLVNEIQVRVSGPQR